jgi:hypothetical protein
MNSDLLIVLSIAAILLFLASLAGGIVCIVRYIRTKKIAFLIVGLLLTLVVPGLLLCAALAVWIPSTMIVYGPPESFSP